MSWSAGGATNCNLFAALRRGHARRIDIIDPVYGISAADPPALSRDGWIEEELRIDGLVHRFRPESRELPMGKFEGAFLLLLATR
jgi:hypothetical protein